MPILEIAESTGELTSGYAARLIATMRYPAEPNRRDEFVAAYLALCVATHEENHAASPEWIKFLARLPLVAAQKAFKDAGGVRALEHLIRRQGQGFDGTRIWVRRGLVAADVLLFLLSHARASPERASVNKAKKFVEQHAKSAWTPPVSESFIEKSWSEYRGVAHLWAVFRLSGESDLHSLIRGRSWALQFLAEAEALRRESTRLRRRAKDPELIPDAWRPPPSLKLPNAKQDVPAFTEKHRELLLQQGYTRI